MFKPVSSKLNVNEMEESVLKFWNDEKIFEKSTENRKGGKEYIFFEGPPTANGKPGVHHVLARSFKDIILRYRTMQGCHISRKGGWDTHGLPVEIEVEKKLGFTHMIVPKNNLQGLDTRRFHIQLIAVRKVEEALRALFG